MIPPRYIRHPRLRKLWKVIHSRRWLRNVSGFALLFAGIIGPITPVLGLWMLPLGLVLLSVDFQWADRLNSRLHDWLRKRGSRLSSAFVRKDSPKSSGGDHPPP